MDIKALMDELLEHGCILQSREALAQGIIEKHAAPAVAEEVPAQEKVEEGDASSEER